MFNVRQSAVASMKSIRIGRTARYAGPRNGESDCKEYIVTMWVVGRTMVMRVFIRAHWSVVCNSVSTNVDTYVKYIGTGSRNGKSDYKEYIVTM